jgi:hypothetical protein
MSGLPVNRAAIKNALMTLGTNVTFSPTVNGFSTWAQAPSRRLKLFNAVDPGAQPAMFLVQHREGYITGGVGRLTRRYLDMGFWCYAPTPEGIVGDDLLDIMESALEGALAPDDPTRNELTLGGLCYWCRITRDEGMFIRDPGDIDGQALLVLPVRILLP